MLDFIIKINPGKPIYEQIVQAVKSAVSKEQLKPGQAFPSVRKLSQFLKVNPNTVQKAIGVLTQENILVVYPGKGCFVAEKASLPEEVIKQRLSPFVEDLINESIYCGIDLEKLNQIIEEEWKRLNHE